jgi:hypothetical protein
MEQRVREQERGGRGGLTVSEVDGPNVIDASVWPGTLAGDALAINAPVPENDVISTNPDPSTPNDPLPGETDVDVYDSSPDPSDITGPRSPSAPITSTRLGTHEVAWDGFAEGGENMDWDLAYVAVHRSTEGPEFEPTDQTYYDRLLNRGSVIVTGTAYGSVWYYRFVAVDTSGNSSQPSIASAPVTTVALVDTDVIGKVLDGAKFMDGTVDTAALADGSVDAAKIALAAIDATKVNFTASDIGGISATFAPTAPASPNINAIWYDTDDNNKGYRWNGTIWEPLSAAASVGSSGNAIFYQPTAPTGGTYIANDLWFDTDDGHKPYYWNGSAWTPAVFGGSALGTNSVTATQLADGSVDAAALVAGSVDTSKINFTARAIGGIATTYAATAPGSPLTGDLWFDTDDNMRPWRWSGSAWVDVRDATIAIAQSAINAKARIYYATTGPVGANTNDLWFDTDDGYKPYFWNGSTWSPMVFGSSALAANSVTASQLADGSVDAAAVVAGSIDTSKINFTARQIGGITTTYATTAPGSPVAGDLWFDTDDNNHPWRWSGSAWVDLRDALITAAQTTADGKNAVFYQTTAPSTTGRKVGDLWFDTDDGHKPYYWNGTAWTAAVFGGSALGADSVTTTQLANGSVDAAAIINGAVVSGKIAANSIGATEIIANSITAGQIAAATITATQLAANSVVAGKIAAGAVTAGTIAADAVTANEIAANAVTASEIAAGAIVAGKIAAGVVGATEIAAGAITAGKIAAGVITSTELAANSVVAGKIAAGAVTASAIAAQAITADKMLVGDTSNMAEVSESVAGTVSYGAWTTAVSGGYATRSGTKDQYFMFRNQKGPLQFKTNDRIRLTFEAFSSATVSVTPTVWIYPSGSAQAMGGAFNITTTPTTFAFELTITLTTAAQTAYLIGLIGAGLATTDVSVRNVRAYVMNAGELIVDGSIIATKIAAGAITAGKIAAGVVGATEIAANSITAGQIAAGTITSNELAANSVVAGKIAAGAVTAGTIAANVVTSTTIATDAVTAGKIAAGAITAGKIAAGAVTAGTISAGAIGATELAANSVVAGKIAANAVVAGNIAALAVTTGTIAANAITADKIAAGAITAVALSADAIDGKTITGVTITGSVVTGTTVRTAASGDYWELLTGGSASVILGHSSTAFGPGKLQVVDDYRLIPSLMVESPQFSSGDPKASVQVSSGLVSTSQPSLFSVVAEQVDMPAIGFEAGRISPTQSYSAGTLTAMQWAAASLEKGTHGWVRLGTTGVNAAQWVCPEDGVYSVTAVVGFSTAASTRGFINLFAGAARASRHVWTNEVVAGGSQTTFIAAGDIVKVETFSNVAGSYNGGYLAIYKVGY